MATCSRACWIRAMAVSRLRLLSRAVWIRDRRAGSLYNSNHLRRAPVSVTAESVILDRGGCRRPGEMALG